MRDQRGSSPMCLFKVFHIRIRYRVSACWAQFEPPCPLRDLKCFPAFPRENLSTFVVGRRVEILEREDAFAFNISFLILDGQLDRYVDLDGWIERERERERERGGESLSARVPLKFDA